MSPSRARLITGAASLLYLAMLWEMNASLIMVVLVAASVLAYMYSHYVGRTLLPLFLALTLSTASCGESGILCLTASSMFLVLITAMLLPLDLAEGVAGLLGILLLQSIFLTLIFSLDILLRPSISIYELEDTASRTMLIPPLVSAASYLTAKIISSRLKEGRMEDMRPLESPGH